MEIVGRRNNHPPDGALLPNGVVQWFHPKLDKVTSYSLHPSNLCQPLIITKTHDLTLFKKPKLPNKIVHTFGTNISREMSDGLIGTKARVGNKGKRFGMNRLCVFGIFDEFGMIVRAWCA